MCRGWARMIQLVNVHKSFGDLVVLDGVDFEVIEGETVALLGPSGTGKSVLLKHINGLLHPDLGDVFVAWTWSISNAVIWRVCATVSAMSFSLGRCSIR